MTINMWYALDMADVSQVLSNDATWDFSSIQGWCETSVRDRHEVLDRALNDMAVLEAFIKHVERRFEMLPDRVRRVVYAAWRDMEHNSWGDPCNLISLYETIDKEQETNE